MFIFKTTEEAAKFFNCSVEAIKKQYASNAETFKIMLEKAENTGKKVNGYTAQQLKESYEKYKKLSN